MIVTVTLNPALDKTAHVHRVRPGVLHRLQGVMIDAGGKGVNVSGVVSVLGGKTIATGFAGGTTGDELLMRLDERGISHDFVRTAGATRINLKLIDDEGGLTEFNEPGAWVSPGEWQILEKKLYSLAAKDTLFVLSGSLPQGLGADTYRNLCTALRGRKGARVFVDADGEPLRQALLGGPDYVKPNRYELLQYFSAPPDTPEPRLVDFCRELVSKGLGLAALSMGDEGALFVTKAAAYRAPPLSVPVHSTVGAGDSMVAALAYGLDVGLSPEQGMTLAVAASAAAVTTPGTKPPDLALIKELETKVELRQI
ncbi:MAG: 1-phosphofructokinase [Spirochaetales bacterium]|jgi:1-phosphofructokinase|nr:1-phosphofructokinase [Spirochaetales bacterium]